MKRLAIPIEKNLGLQSVIAQHFGRAPAYAIVTESKELVSTIDNISDHFGGKGKPPELLKEKNIDILLCGGLGPNAIKLFENFGIEVFVGAKGTIEETIDLFKAGQLSMATDENACKEHRH